MQVLFSTFFVWLVSSPPPGAQPDPPPPSPEGIITTGKCQDTVEIGLNYQGDQFSLWGQVPPSAQGLVAVLESPHQPSVKLVRKGRVMGLWFGVKQFQISHLPDLFMVNMTDSDLDRLNRQLAAHGGAGYARLKKRAEVQLLRGEAESDDEEVLFKGFFEIKEKAGLYAIRPNSIHPDAQGRFFHSFAVPDKAQEGEYRITTYVLGEEGLLGVKQDQVAVRQVGLVARLARMARTQAWGYGILAVVVALAAGLLVGTLFKKGGGGH